MEGESPVPDHNALAAGEIAALEGFMRAHHIHVNGRLVAEMISGGKSNLTFLLSDDVHRWTYRRPPYSGLTPSAHDVGREFHITNCLHGSRVPVARPVLRCDDPAILGTPFIVTEFVDGRVIRTQENLSEMSDAEVQDCTMELIRVLVDLHQIDPASVGLGDLSRRGDYMRRQFDRWAGQWDLVKNDDSPAIDALRRAVADALPKDSASTITHGDYRIDNVIFASDGTSILAVLDWELAALGDPLADLAMMCMYRGHPLDLILGEQAAWTSARLLPAEQMAEQYSMLSGRQLDHWPAYLAFANFKLAVVAQGIVHRARLDPGRTREAARVQQAVPVLIEQGLRCIALATEA
ncbi:MAG: phosphotransferase [Actinobacteria bacterium]|uniref:Unannotated protein n=1 Tax=freshwater metagenome TaxID=449393 RepID=A0A6J7L0U0_9ZZZZ|nr:phosphotransferase [Actinomycetota bacterium]